MSSSTAILKAEFNLLKEELIAKYDELGMRASGNWANTLKVEAESYSAQITGAAYSEALENGYKPGKQPPSEAIEQWIIAKGISAQIEGDISISSLAYLIARKIGREGWDRANHGGTELISSVITPQRMQLIIDKVSENELILVTSDITNLLNSFYDSI
ncbi:hypothetical protein GN157_00015 [Flavobacterium rakeshii]|uniref:Uncharacterized protein n=1 Tax=Flavobacterium rakeshii TaxID=1038845 RepID=A0A6N8H6D2_9FLAO|nr:hypothetical protein [Flavobacterium rakeshii]MUV02081.1 hypothetical protein [Flavobacterium rakeshii]